MAVYVDCAAVQHRGQERHHMGADSVVELHAFAASIGIARCWFHRGAKIPHYDVTTEQRNAAMRAGAIAVTPRQLVRKHRGA